MVERFSPPYEPHWAPQISEAFGECRSPLRFPTARTDSVLFWLPCNASGRWRGTGWSARFGGEGHASRVVIWSMLLVSTPWNWPDLQSMPLSGLTLNNLPDE